MKFAFLRAGHEPAGTIVAFLAGLCIATFAATAPARAADGADPAVSALRSLFTSPAQAADVMAPAFAERLPPATLGGYVSFYDHVIGVPSSIAKDGDDYSIVSEHGSLRAAITLDANGKIATLRFHDELSAANAEALTRALRADRLAPGWFVPAAADGAAFPRTQKIVDDLHAALGPFVRLDTRHGAYVAVFARGETHAQISVDNSGKIVYLSFEKP